MNRLDPHQRERYIAYLQNHVNPKRLKHSLGVAQTAVFLAEKYGADPEKAEIAGLLHDCSKGLSYAEMIRQARSHGKQPDEYQIANPELLHPFVSAFLVEDELNIHDPEILTAIRRHMCGAPNMTTLDAVVNLADYIEPSRTYPDVGEMRALAQDSLLETLCVCLGRTMILNLNAGLIVHPDTLITWNALRMRLSAEKGELYV